MSEVATLVAADGTELDLDVDRWRREATAEEHEALAWACAPVLDVGCGPGRHVLALARRGVMALGVDASLLAAADASARGAPVLVRSVFDRLPGSGRWASALLIDGNIGIGGDPVALLRRLRDLLSPNGRVVAEVAGPGVHTGPRRVRVERGRTAGPWFAWAVVGVDGLGEVADAAGFAVADTLACRGRWFARLDRR